MTKTEAKIIRNLYIFRWKSVPLRNTYDINAAEALEDLNLIRLRITDSDMWAERLELKGESDGVS